MKISRNCNLNTFYKGLNNLPVSLIRDFLIKLNPESENLPYKRSKQYYIKAIRDKNPKLATLWRVRDELFKESIDRIGQSLKEIQTEIEELKNNRGKK